MDSNNSSLNSDSDESRKRLSHLEPRFECPICLNCLKEPYLTSCGHRFCEACILGWLRKGNRVCPVDGMSVEERDLFPDNYTRREIAQQTVRCTFPDCKAVTSLLEMESHVAQNHENNVPSSSLFNGSDRIANDWDAPAKQPSTPQNQLIMSLFERIVHLEQRSREQELQLGAARSGLAQLTAERDNFMAALPLRVCNGSHIWTVKSIREKLETMLREPTEMYYSEGFYTSYNGYKFCGRLNISPNNGSYVSLLVHLMRGENDDFLPWPFKGRISFSLIHPRETELTLTELMCTKTGLKAFEKPTAPISPRAFGYTEFTLIEDILHRGFIYENGSINIKIDINCV